MSRIPLGRLATLAALAVTVTLCGGAAVSASAGWTVQPVPDPGGHGYDHGATLWSVSCSGKNWCFAVGEIYRHHLEGYRWNGTSWAKSWLPVPADIATPVLSAISCYSAVDCMAVGTYEATGQPTYTLQPLVEHWTGKGWQLESFPLPAGTNHFSLNAVSCPAATSCTAVGTYSTQDLPVGPELAESWNGTSWTIEPTPSVGDGQDNLTGVSCHSADSCEAVGAYTVNSARTETLAQSWDGSNWTVQDLPHSGYRGGLTAVSCSPARSPSSACTAVGYRGPSSGTPTALFLRWNGTKWFSMRPSADITNLYGVSCPTASSCTAAGESSSDSALVTQWNGAAWVTQDTPREPASVLFAVSCPGAAFCMAVGVQPGDGQDNPFSEDN